MNKNTKIKPKKIIRNEMSDSEMEFELKEYRIELNGGYDL